MAKPKKQTKQKQKRYSTQEKVDAILILKSNEHNFTKTAKTVGVSTHTIKKWYNQFGFKIDQELESNPDIKRSVAEYAEHKEEFVKEISETKMEAIKVVRTAIAKLAEKPENITPYFFQQLNNTIKMIHDIENDKEPKTNGEENTEESRRWTNVKKQIINQNTINIQNNNKNE